MTANESPPARDASTTSASRIATNPTWVIAAYQCAAVRTAALWRCSASTKSSEDSAMSSQSTSNVDALPAAGTISRLHTNKGYVACTARPDKPSAE
jgi:hypothetical protein